MMKTTLLTDVTIEEICKGFFYNELEGKGLFGWSGKLVIQPEYQRNYLYAEAKMEEDVVKSVINGLPLGLLYFNKVGKDKYEVLDGQQRITSLGRFMTGRFPIKDSNGMPHYYPKLPGDYAKIIRETPLTIYICEGDETEIKAWFRTINIGGIKLNDQEIANATYSGPFVTKAKETFSNSRNSNIQKWSAFVKGNVSRQDYLRTALEWITKSTNSDIIGQYMSKHRDSDDISELETYFNNVIDWASATFNEIYPKMRGLNWGRLYETYHNIPYDSDAVSAKVAELMAEPDEVIKNKSGIFEFVLGGCTDTQLLDIRIFDTKTKQTVYARQTAEAKANNVSNCPLCAAGTDNNRQRIYKLNEMEADHVTAWSNGGATDISNCTMLCKIHNRIKGNK